MVEAVILNQNNAKGILVREVDPKDISNIDF